MVIHANGSFEVKLVAQKHSEGIGDQGIGRMSIEKTFRGDLAAKSQGEMLAFRTETEGSAGYVAMERVTGTLGGKRGAFVLQHSGLMTRGKPELTVTVVPDSGTEELTDLAGVMTIKIEGRDHFYDFAYTLPGQNE